jgi:hypothetical protein
MTAAERARKLRTLLNATNAHPSLTTNPGSTQRSPPGPLKFGLGVSRRISIRVDTAHMNLQLPDKEEAVMVHTHDVTRRSARAKATF